MTVVDRKAKAKEALLEAAKRLFTERGYDAVSTRELAEAAGVNLGAIQYHFGSKARLFVETLHRLMEGGRCEESELALQGEITSSEHGAQMLFGFVSGFLRYLLDHQEGPAPCRLMFREIFTNTRQDPEMFEALTSSVVNEFIKPVDDALARVISAIRPELTKPEIEGACQSIVGQCTFYVTHAPFLDRLRGCSVTSCERHHALARHVTIFSLRGIGCDPGFVSRVAESIDSQCGCGKEA